MTAYRYWKWNFTGGNNTAIMVGTLSLFVGGVDVCLGKSVSADGASHYPVANVVDNAVSQWQHNAAYPHFATIDLGAAYDPSYYIVQGGGDPTFCPTAWTLSGSNDGSTWFLLDTQTAQTWPSGYYSRTCPLAAARIISGFILDASGLPIVRTIMVFNRNTGLLVGTTTSSAALGAWSLFVVTDDELQVVMLDDSLGTLENDQILRVAAV